MKRDTILPEVINKSGAAMLASGIVKQAVKEWKDAKKALSKNPDNKIALGDINEIESFFRSDWYKTLREFAPDVIPEKMLEVLNK